MSAFQPGGTKGCVDDEDKCEEWAILGECERTLLHAAFGLLLPLLPLLPLLQLLLPLSTAGCGVERGSAARRLTAAAVGAVPMRGCAAGENNPAFMKSKCRKACEVCS